MTPAEQPHRETGLSSQEPRAAKVDYESAVLQLLLQEHRSSRANLTVFDVLGRLMSVSLVVYVGLISELSTPQLISCVSAVISVAMFWQWGRRRAIRRIYGIEETLSRTTEGLAERTYIEYRFIAESGRDAATRIMQIEPGIWLCLSLIIILVAVIVGGVTS